MTRMMGSHTDLIGTRCVGEMCEKKLGKPPSRAQAHVRRDAEAILPRVTAQEMTSKPQTIAVAARVDPVAC